MKFYKIIAKYMIFLWTLYTLLFLALNYAVSDPALFLLGPFTSIDTVNRLREALGLNHPLWIRYFYQLKAFLIPSNLTSIYYHRSVIYLILHMGIYTIVYITAVYIISVSLGWFLAILPVNSGKESKFYFRLFNISLIPPYIIGLFIFWILNTLGVTTWHNLFLYQIFLVILSSFHPTSLVIYFLNKGISEEFKKRNFPYLYVAKGFNSLKVNFLISRRYLPSVAAQLIALMGYIVSSIFFFEFLFNVPGIGNVFINAILRNDRNVVLSFALILGSITYASYLIGEEIIKGVFKYKTLYLNGSKES